MSDVVRRRVYFECGHRVYWPDAWNRRIATAAARTQDQVEKHWRGHAAPRAIGDHGWCPDCPGSRGLHQTVVGVINVPLVPERERGH